MRKIALFAEDIGHEAFLQALVRRLARQYQVAAEVRSYSARGGHGKMLSELAQFIRDLKRYQQDLPDLLIVARDGNCRGFAERQQEIDGVTAGFDQPLIYAIPDPHIERWLLLDSAAFKTVLGKGCAAPDQKCERDRYKRLLLDAIRDAGLTPLLGGIEHAEALVNEMNLRYLQQADDSLGRLLKALHDQFKQWKRA
jgi:hypothetical protein